MMKPDYKGQLIDDILDEYEEKYGSFKRPFHREYAVHQIFEITDLKKGITNLPLIFWNEKMD